jgi:hypothetical protein
MKTMKQLVAIVLAVLPVVTILNVANAKSGGSSFNVTTTVHDTDSGNTPTLMKSDDFNSSGQASYSAKLNPNIVNDVYNGTLFLNLYSQSLRTLYITPNDAINNQQPQAPPPGYYSQYVEMYVTCYEQNGNVVPL